MQKMQKYFAVLLVICMSLGLSACGGSSSNSSQQPSSESGEIIKIKLSTSWGSKARCRRAL